MQAVATTDGIQGVVPKNVKITKVKRTGDPAETLIQFVRSADGHEPTYHVIKTKDNPHPDLITAMEVLNDHFQIIAEQYDADGDPATCELTGVSLSYKDGRLGAILTGKRYLHDSNAPIIINTPKKLEDLDDEEEDEKRLLSEAAFKAIESLQEEAWKFVDGKRQQMSLFKNEEEANGAFDFDEDEEPSAHRNTDEFEEAEVLEEVEE